jgi:hypothetical protein
MFRPHPKPEKVIKVKKGLKKKFPKPTGEGQLFLEIWEERPHICINCKTPLGDEPKTYFFAHIIGKGRAPELRLKKINIMLLCFDCHRAYDQGTKEEYSKRFKK